MFFILQVNFNERLTFFTPFLTNKRHGNTNILENTQKKAAFPWESGCEKSQMELSDRPVTLVGVIDGEFLAGHMTIKMEHIAEFIVVEADLAVGIRLRDGGIRPMIDASGGIDDGVRGRGFLEFGDLPSVGIVVVDIATEPFGLEVGTLHWVGILAGQTCTAACDGARVTDVRADEQLVLASINGAEIRPPHEPVVRGFVGRFIHVDDWNILGVVILIHGMGETHLLEVACARDGHGFFTGLRKGGQQHGGQDGDDGDDDQKFDQREGKHFFDFVHWWFLF